MGRTGTKPGSKGRNWPEGERGTRKAGWRLTPPALDAVAAAAAELHETASATAEALLAVGLRHLDEVRAELAARAEAAPEKKST